VDLGSQSDSFNQNLCFVFLKDQSVPLLWLWWSERNKMQSVPAKEPSRKVQRKILMGWGFVIRDNFLDVICAGMGKLDHSIDPLQTEPVSTLCGVAAAIDLGMGNIMVETDALAA